MTATIAQERDRGTIGVKDIYKNKQNVAPSAKLKYLRHSRYYSYSLILGSQLFIDTVMEDIGNKAIQTRREVRHVFDLVLSGKDHIRSFYHLKISDSK